MRKKHSLIIGGSAVEDEFHGTFKGEENEKISIIKV